MVSFKALCLVGVAGLVATTTAHAADLLPPPILPEAPVYQRPASVLSGNVYLRGDVGIGVADLRTQSSSFETNVPDARFEQKSLDDSGIIDVGVGYRFNQYFRADVTGEYRTAAQYRATESYNVGAFNYANGISSPNGNRDYDNYSASIRSIVGLVNGYVDVGTWWCVTPFFGAGVGVANVSVNGLTDIGYGGSGFIDKNGNFQSGNGGGFSGNHSQTNFAYALMAGLDFAVTPNLTLELGYRYLNMGNVSSGAVVCTGTGSCPYEVQHYKLASNDIRLGFRYTFADYAPAPRPVIARY